MVWTGEVTLAPAVEAKRVIDVPVARTQPKAAVSNLRPNPLSLEITPRFEFFKFIGSLFLMVGSRSDASDDSGRAWENHENGVRGEKKSQLSETGNAIVSKNSILR